MPRAGSARHAFASLVETLRPAVAADPALTWFELFTALAFLHFARSRVDVAVVEVGLGGRLDATNVLTPLVSVITRLSLDHTSLLGTTLAAIAAEKGGIIKRGVPLVSAPQPAEAAAVLARLAAERGAPLAVVGQEWQYISAIQPGRKPTQTVTLTRAPAGSLLPCHQPLPLALVGAHQAENSVVAAAALTLAAPSLPRLDGDAIRAGWAGLRWPGRLQALNPDATDATRCSWSTAPTTKNQPSDCGKRWPRPTHRGGCGSSSAPAWTNITRKCSPRCSPAAPAAW